MYRGLPIVTNKIPPEEQNGVKHHLIDHIGLEESPWMVHEFVKESPRVIDAIRARGKLPIVVGGTNYYVFSLLFPDSTVSKSDDEDESKITEGSVNADVENDRRDGKLAILGGPTEEIYAKLQEIDPAMARQWHPKDRRKIQRSLEIWLTTGRRASDVYAEQKEARVDGADGIDDSIMRYDPLIFWMEAEGATLKQRLDARVGTMVQNGLLDEVKLMREFELECKSKAIELDKSKGIWVAIGYKELEAWLKAQEAGMKDTKVLGKLKDDGIEAVKAGTRQYAKRQNRWIRIRLAKALEDKNMLNRLFLLDCTQLDMWGKMVEAPSEQVVQSFITGQELPDNRSLSPLASRMFSRVDDRQIEIRQVHFCETCQKTLMTEAEWKKHLRSSGHKKVLDGIRRRAERNDTGKAYQRSQARGTSAERLS